MTDHSETFTAATGGGGEEARALVAANEYDVVLLDLRLSGLGGDTLYRELCDRDRVSKPFELDDLAAALAGMTN